MLFKASPGEVFILRSLNLCPAAFPPSSSGCRLSWKGGNVRTTPSDRQRKRRALLSLGLGRPGSRKTADTPAASGAARVNLAMFFLTHSLLLNVMRLASGRGLHDLWKTSKSLVVCAQGKCLRVKNQQVYLKVPMAWKQQDPGLRILRAS